eukprot:COSAG01_NODE_40461_length_463_cov_1.098901_1_plen_48_part_10
MHGLHHHGVHGLLDVVGGGGMVDGGAMITMDQRRRRHAPADGEDGAVA